MTEVLVLRARGDAWRELEAVRTEATGGWVRVALSDAVASELRLPVGTVALVATVSRYLGETEKQLANVFAAAEDNECVLLLDESDALFGKRTDVRSAHDRYANLETSFLLSRLEIAQAIPLTVRRNRQRFRWPPDA